MRLFDTVLITASSERQAGGLPRAPRAPPRAGALPAGARLRGGPRPARRAGRHRRQHAVGPAPAARDAGRATRALSSARSASCSSTPGGESRRLPCYAPEGKLFSPLPIASSALLPPVVLDVQLGLFFKYPWRRGRDRGLVRGRGDRLRPDLASPRSARRSSASPSRPRSSRGRGTVSSASTSAASACSTTSRRPRPRCSRARRSSRARRTAPSTSASSRSPRGPRTPSSSWGGRASAAGRSSRRWPAAGCVSTSTSRC